MEKSLESQYRPVNSMNDLQQFGINALTGEACAYSMRTLCDVNEAGKELLADFFGMPDIVLAKNWNTTTNGCPSIGSIMLSNDMVPKLAQFAFFRAGALAIAVMGSTIHGIFDSERLASYDEHQNAYPKGYSLYRNYALKPGAQEVIGSRNVHAFTGRAY